MTDSDPLTTIRQRLDRYPTDDAQYSNNCPGCREYRFDEFWELRADVERLLAIAEAARDAVAGRTNAQPVVHEKALDAFRNLTLSLDALGYPPE